MNVLNTCFVLAVVLAATYVAGTAPNSAATQSTVAAYSRQSDVIYGRKHGLALEDARVPVRLVVREGKAHAWEGWEADTALIAEWFDTHLR